jgi:hypothetical protein
MDEQGLASLYELAYDRCQTLEVEQSVGRDAKPNKPVANSTARERLKSAVGSGDQSLDAAVVRRADCGSLLLREVGDPERRLKRDDRHIDPISIEVPNAGRRAVRFEIDAEPTFGGYERAADKIGGSRTRSKHRDEFVRPDMTV